MLRILVTVNTKRASLLKTAIASSASCWRAPFFFNFKKGASERASERASKRLRKVREQASINVPPVVRGQRRDFTNVGEQAKDRGASIKFYRAMAGGLA